MRKSSPFKRCHQLKIIACSLLAGAGFCSARQDALNHQKSLANSYASAHFGVGADDSVRPRDAPLFTGICGESVLPHEF